MKFKNVQALCRAFWWHAQLLRHHHGNGLAFFGDGLAMFYVHVLETDENDEPIRMKLNRSKPVDTQFGFLAQFDLLPEEFGLDDLATVIKAVRKKVNRKRPRAMLLEKRRPRKEVEGKKA
jgi:hypothetical protein